ncbi:MULTISPECIES: L-aspartate oxidase [Bacillales]|jgi:L-aspartate oxidase|uniref:L-aspartate oxidase n=1 Tax=Brevibacillus aydinogluensis TaxID=927786 RepID=A0AA48RJ95_9BACL|nr:MULTISPECIES: L-aspartate oxidase [Bacillales]MBR8659852.1 L-aspartate oxidase [Brevibacillus sp. NL20B1]MDT3416799.1 L-aspartate oxidase [Brevibacillus aydinogluensis]NNV04235.1 L-aspartate oxidase [Brevibacillus sp. MCWH]UFJ62327.1 L-aspartate oxidase [Anoxybacillus sediminis]CAJ1004573.1 L-aspartate oxidase [Brevibacillus aydinogluensis]
MIPRYIVDFDLHTLPRVKTDVAVIGAGIAGLYTALQASEYADVVLISKKGLDDSNTRWAQGGIAAVTAKSDSPALHRQDTLIAGAGLCSYAAVEVLVHEGPERLKELIAYGTKFDKDAQGRYELTKEGAHSKRRILHAHGDATGAEIVRALSARVRDQANITVLENHFAIDVVTQDGECVGVIVQNQEGGLFFLESNATVLATGGAGQLYRYTTNPDIATADGIAMAYRAGARIKDVEFIQFHPTALYYPGAPRFLISEAVRGEGAILRNTSGERFMEKYHPQKELAPRDVVARAIVSEMEKTHSSYVYLDITHESEELIKHRFPTIYRFCLQYGLDMVTDWIPVAPACHYIMGGVQTDLNGETSTRRLFACGEVSCTGVHGANRLASNSLSEAVVFGHRIVRRIRELTPLPEVRPFAAVEPKRTSRSVDTREQRVRLQKLMLRHVGLKRHEKGLRKALDELERMQQFCYGTYSDRESFEFLNLLNTAVLTTRAALLREESRGGHYRIDFPNKDDLIWRKHIIQSIGEGVREESEQYDVE